MTENNIQAALREAASKAQESNPSTSVVPAAGTASVPATRARMTAADFRSSARTNVDKYLKVDKSGMTIGTDQNTLIETFEATIKMSDLKFCKQLRFGDPVQYFKSYDGVKSTDGRSWSEVLAHAKSVKQDRTTDPFDTAEMVLTLTGPVKDIKGNPVKDLGAGTTLGYTPPYTGAPELANLMQQIEELGGNPDTATVQVTVTSQAKSGKGKNWGIVLFKANELV